MTAVCEDLYPSRVGDAPKMHYRQSLKRQQVGVPDHDSLASLAGGRS